MPSARLNIGHTFSLVVAILLGMASAAIAQAKSAELSADCSAYASVPLPAEATKVTAPKAPPACASYRSYRGIGQPVNYSEARACAWQERLAQKAGLGQNEQQPIAWVVGGSLILADLYFNGFGVPKNLPLALRFACESDEEMAKLALAEIDRADVPRRAKKPFEFCDYAASTFTMNFCTAYSSEIEDERRNRYYRSVKSSMSAEQQAAFERLLVAENAYVDAHASEVDQGGTIRAMRTIGSQAILKDLFYTELLHFERKKWPALSDKQISTADELLRRELENTQQRLRTATSEEIEQGAVTSDNVSRVQRSWQDYRDAWVAFARLRYPDAADVIQAKITLDRYRLLKTMR